MATHHASLSSLHPTVWGPGHPTSLGPHGPGADMGPCPGSPAKAALSNRVHREESARNSGHAWLLATAIVRLCETPLQRGSVCV